MSGTIIEALDSLMASALIFEIEERAHNQRMLDGMGCDEGCGLCGSNGTYGAAGEYICFWHHRASCAWPRKFAK